MRDAAILITLLTLAVMAIGMGVALIAGMDGWPTMVALSIAGVGAWWVLARMVEDQT